MPYIENIHLSARAILFAAAVSAIGGVLFSTGPALHFLFSDLRTRLTEGGRGAASMGWRRWGASLVATEIAITVVLLVGAGLLAKSFYRLLHVDVGLRPSHLALLHVSKQSTGSDAAANVQFERRVMTRIAALPDVTAVGVSGKPVVASGEDFKQTRLEHRSDTRS
jgi:hypothetical protein